MLCVSLGIKDLDRTIEILSAHDMGEIRLDLSGFNKNQIHQLIQTGKELIFTYRKKDGISDIERLELLEFAAHNGAAWIDIDIQNEKTFIDAIKRVIKANLKTKLIISYHNYSTVPTNQVLFDILIRAKDHDPNLIKIACFSNGNRDNERILPFNKYFENVLAFNMGQKGESTRVRCLFEGALFSYVSIPEASTAEGQLDKQEMEKRINSERNKFLHETGKGNH